MTKLAALAFVLITTTLAAGCGCGAYNGAGDRVYARGSDQLILCENGGFTAMTSAGTLEGRIVTNPNTGVESGVEGDDGQTMFTIDDPGDGTIDTTGFGSAWTLLDLDQTDLDHADVLCTDLATRAWWSPS